MKELLGFASMAATSVADLLASAQRWGDDEIKLAGRHAKRLVELAVSSVKMLRLVLMLTRTGTRTGMHAHTCPVTRH